MLIVSESGIRQAGIGSADNSRSPRFFETQHRMQAWHGQVDGVARGLPRN
jgi:hypothetical protein